jgi:TetR/AcrR family transcriptional regulator, tetracycline repressor protein
MTIRSLAADLGVSPMALYHYVRDKDDLLDEVADRLLVRAWKPRADPANWKAWIVEAADKMRHFLVSQPAALHVYLAHPVTSPTAMARMNALMGVLSKALGDQQAAEQAYAAIHTYTIGFAALEASRAESEKNHPAARPPSDQRAERLAAYTTPQQFTQGLHYLLAGILQDHAHHAA